MMRGRIFQRTGEGKGKTIAARFCPEPERFSCRGARPPRALWPAPSRATSRRLASLALFGLATHSEANRRERRLAAPGAGALPICNCIVPAERFPN